MTRSRLTRRLNLPVAVAAMALAVGACGAATSGDAELASERGSAAETHATPVPSGKVRLVGGVNSSEVFGSSSRRDWVNVADHVVAAVVISDERIDRTFVRPAQDSRGVVEPDDEGHVYRKVTLEINDVLWTDRYASRPVPDVVTVLADGWWHDSGVETKSAPSGGSRLEVGNDYVMALAWVPALCAPGEREPHRPAQWVRMGSGGALPANGDVLGAGEFEGTITDRVARRDDHRPPTAIDGLAGESLESLRDALADTKQTEAEGAFDEFVCAD